MTKEVGGSFWRLEHKIYNDVPVQSQGGDSHLQVLSYEWDDRLRPCSSVSEKTCRGTILKKSKSVSLTGNPTPPQKPGFMVLREVAGKGNSFA